MSRFNLVALIVIGAGMIAATLGVRGTYAQFGRVFKGMPTTPAAAAKQAAAPEPGPDIQPGP